MPFIDRRYTIRFAYAGYHQYAELYEVKGKLHNPRVRVSYMKVDEQPDVSKCETVDEVLEIIKGFAYGGRAVISHINGAPPKYDKDKKSQTAIKSWRTKYDNFIEAEAKKFFEEIIEPYIKERDWFISTSHIGFPIFCYNNPEDGEWDNIPQNEDEQYLQLLCGLFAKTVREVDMNTKTEHGSKLHCAKSFLSLLPINYFDEKGLFIKL